MFGQRLFKCIGQGEQFEVYYGVNCGECMFMFGLDDFDIILGYVCIVRQCYGIFGVCCVGFKVDCIFGVNVYFLVEFNQFEFGIIQVVVVCYFFDLVLVIDVFVGMSLF